MPSRRQFLTAGAGAAAAFALPDAAWARRRPRRLRGGRFAQGVLSGEPSPDAITLLTVLDDVGGRGSVRVEVARDPGFRRLVAVGDIQTSAERHHSVKARIFGLEPSQEYHYRFETRGSHSAVGRFRTAPAPDSRQPIRFAVFSCANWAFGHYNAYELMAREDDLDFVVNLGDYVYAESDSGGRNARADRIGREIDGDRQAVTLADYRAKYALYRTDPALRHMHARHAMVSIWDDHEVMNNYAGAAPGGGLPGVYRFGARRRAAYRAFFEHMPVHPSGRSRIYRSLRFGRNLDLLLLDQRQYRDDQPCGDPLDAPECLDRTQRRAFLGDRQLRWFKDRLSRSPATWKVVGNQLFIMPLKSAPDRYAFYDTWQGYLSEREDVVRHIRRRDVGGVVFATGDFHSFLAGDVRPGESSDPHDTVATEFHSGSISSQSIGEASDDEAADYAALRAHNPWVAGGDITHHGYGVMEARRNELTVTYRRLKTVRQRSLERLPDLDWSVRPHRPSLHEQNG
jgi:alkaline phosphatase D